MARFRFRLETLLKLRRRQEDEQKRLVAARLRQIGDAERRRQALEHQILRQADALRRALVEKVLNVEDLRLSRYWLTQLRRGLLEAGAELSAHRALLAQEQAALRAARTRARVLDSLKDRQFQAHLAQERRREQTELDEMSILRIGYGRAVLFDEEA